jgi:hypothetical protein
MRDNTYSLPFHSLLLCISVTISKCMNHECCNDTHSNVLSDRVDNGSKQFFSNQTGVF